MPPLIIYSSLYRSETSSVYRMLSQDKRNLGIYIDTHSILKVKIFARDGWPDERAEFSPNVVFFQL